MRKFALPILACMVAATMGLGYLWSGVLNSTSNMPLEDSYWHVNQFEKSILGLRGDLLEVAIGAPDAGLKAQQALAIALSKNRILTRESKAQESLLQDANFAANLHRLKDFENEVLEPAAAEGSVMDEAQARKLLRQVEQMRGLMADLSPGLWQLQGEQNEYKFQLAQRRAMWNFILSIGLAASAMLALATFVYFYFRLKDKNGELKQKNKQLAQTIDEKNQFIGMVSHELKSPLQAITLSAESLSPYISAEAQNAIIGRLQRAAVQLNMQLNDLLTLVRSDEGKLEYRPDLFEVQGLLEEIVDIEAPAAGEKKLAIHFHVPQDPVFAMADSGRLAQILRNLVSNAIKYTDQGEVEIALESVSEDALEFTVRDTGPGMPAGFEPKSIQPFQRYGAIDKREGFGIGLMIAYSLTEYLGGSLTFVSDAEGTCFRLKVPVTFPDDDLPVASTTAGPLRVLVVDDRPELLTSLRGACAAHGMEADVAISAAVAANLMATHHYDCALIDVNMPVRRGDELAQDFRRGGAMVNKACLLIGMSADRHPHLASESPFDLMLDKPIQIKMLRRVLQRLGSSSTSADRP